MKNSAALTAQAIRKELKAAYPSVPFRVTSKTYSGGDSVNVSYIATLTTPKQEEVEALLSKYEGGHFNGMEDIYEYKSGAGELTTKYLFVHADLDTLMAEYKPRFMQEWGLMSDSDAECRAKTGRWFLEALRNYIRTVVLCNSVLHSVFPL